MPENIDLSRTPYFDTYDEYNRYLRILFRSGRPVQTRELNQIQTILKNQVKRFASNIFNNGSRVIGGAVELDKHYSFVKIPDGLNSNDDETYIGGTVTDQNGVTATIANVERASNSDPDTIYVNYQSSGTDSDSEQATEFASGASLTLNYESGSETKTAGDVGTGVAVHLSSGIYYINGEFHLVDAQTLILSKYSTIDNVAKISVGLVLDEHIVTYQDDNNLLDNAFGAKGYGAPGADRYQAYCFLVENDGKLDNDAYVEIMNIQNGVVASSARSTDLSVIEQTLARRTYDESGDYVVKEFAPSLKQHLKNATNPDGVYDESEGGDESKLVLSVGAGKAYVRGFEVETKVNTLLSVDKARTTDTTNNILVSMQLGNYLYINSPYTRPKLFDRINFYTGTVATAGQEPTGQIGYGWIKDFNYDVDTQKFRIYLFDINIDPDKAFSSIRSVFQDSTSFTANINLSLSTSDGTQTQLIRQTERAPIYQMPFGVVKNINSSYLNYWQLYSSASVSSGAISLSVTSGSQFRDESHDYIITAASGQNIFPDGVSVDGSSGNTNVTLDVSKKVSSGALSEGDSVQVFAKLQRNSATIRTKTPTQKSYTAKYANGLIDFKLDKPDAYQIISVKGNTKNPVDYTNRFTLDTGQRDTHYALSRVKLKDSEVQPTEDVVVTYKYYEHSEGDYFTVESYVNNNVAYADIPIYTSSNGSSYPLANCIDARLTIKSDGNSYMNTTIFDPDGEANVAYDYYLSRKDKIVVDKSGLFSVVSGTPSRNPVLPNDLDGAMTLYELSIPAYTFSVDNVEINKIDNRRYTMRDIGSIEQRVQNLEYYTSLSLLESHTLSQQFEDRFKSGFVVDNFETQNVMDNDDPNNIIAIDFENNEARPIGTTKAVEFAPDDVSAAKNNGNTITLPYSEIEYIIQPYASEIERLNPFLLAGWYGHLKLNPSSDTWVSTNQRPSVTRDGGVVESVAYQDAKDSLGTIWNNWTIAWTGKPVTTKDDSSQKITDVRWSNGSLSAKYSTTTNTSTSYTEKQKRTGTKTIATSHIKTTNIGNKLVSVSAIPYIRSRNVNFFAKGLKPNTRVYAFFDGTDVTDYCGGSLKTDGVGNISGVFVIPNDNDIKFETGNRRMAITDSVTGDVGTTYAKAIYSATGTLKEYQQEFLSTRVLDVETEKLSDSRTKTISSNGKNVKNATTGSYGRVKTLTGSGGDSDNHAVINFNVPFIPDENGHGVGYFHFNFDTVGSLQDGKNSNGRYYYGPDDEPTGFRIFDASGNKIFDDYVVKNYYYRYSVRNASQAGNFKIEIYSQATPKHGWWKYKLDYTELTGPLPQNTCYTDPIAQSFAIDTDGGAFMTGIGVYFGPVTNDTLRAPVRLQVRNMVNGYPGTNVVPFADVTVPTEKIKGSSDASQETRFEFDAPVYLEEGKEYCFVLLTASENMTAWVATMGQQTKADSAINGKPHITKQPYLGSLFTSQNNRTWTANQNSDIKFRTYRASFATGSQRVTFKKKVDNPKTESDPYFQILPLEPFSTVSGSNTVRVYHQNHGFRAGDKVTFGALDNKYVTSVNGIPYTEVYNKQLTVVDSNGSEYMNPDMYFVKTNSNASTTGRSGGGNVTASQNVEYSILHLLSDTVKANGTGIDWDFRGYSRTNGAMDNSSRTIDAGTNIVLNDSYVSVSSSDGRMILGATLSTDQENISPVIDLERITAICTENKITPQTDLDDSTTGYTGYTRYMLTPVQLENPANELKIILDANRPGGSNIDVFYRVQYPGEDGTITDAKWQKINPDANYPSDSNIDSKREYQFTKTLDKDFQTFAIKIVFSSNQKQNVPRISNLRCIALKGLSDV